MGRAYGKGVCKRTEGRPSKRPTLRSPSEFSEKCGPSERAINSLLGAAGGAAAAADDAGNDGQGQNRSDDDPLHEKLLVLVILNRRKTTGGKDRGVTEGVTQAPAYPGSRPSVLLGGGGDIAASPVSPTLTRYKPARLIPQNSPIRIIPLICNASRVVFRVLR